MGRGAGGVVIYKCRRKTGVDIGKPAVCDVWLMSLREIEACLLEGTDMWWVALNSSVETISPLT